MWSRIFFPLFFFFFNDTATTEIYTLSLHDALPISTPARTGPVRPAGMRPRALAAVTSSVQTLAHRDPCCLDRFREARRVPAAGRRALGPPAATSVDDRREDLLHQLVGVDARDEVLGDVHDERRLSL